MQGLEFFVFFDSSTLPVSQMLKKNLKFFSQKNPCSIQTGRRFRGARLVFLPYGSITYSSGRWGLQSGRSQRNEEQVTFGPGESEQGSRAAGRVVQATCKLSFFVFSVHLAGGRSSRVTYQSSTWRGRVAAVRQLPAGAPGGTNQDHPLRARPSWRVGGLGGASWAQGGADDKAGLATPLPPKHHQWPGLPD